MIKELYAAMYSTIALTLLRKMLTLCALLHGAFLICSTAVRNVLLNSVTTADANRRSALVEVERVKCWSSYKYHRPD